MILLILAIIGQIVADNAGRLKSPFGNRLRLSYVEDEAGNSVPSLLNGYIEITLPLLKGLTASQSGLFFCLRSLRAFIPIPVNRITRADMARGCKRAV